MAIEIKFLIDEASVEQCLKSARAFLADNPTVDPRSLISIVKDEIKSSDSEQVLRMEFKPTQAEMAAFTGGSGQSL